MTSLKNRLTGLKDTEIFPFLLHHLTSVQFERFEFLLSIIGKQAAVEVWLKR